jgi:hypothetical protein
MAWVRFPDGSRRKIERANKADAQADLDELLALRAQSIDPGPRRVRLATFDEVIDAWFEDGCPNSSASKRSRHARTKSPNTLTNARQLLDTSVRPVVGKLRVDRTSTERLEALFAVSPSGPWKSTTTTPARPSRRLHAAGVASGFTRSSLPPCTATRRRCGCSVYTATRASSSAAATARR